jgi:hypothetical protein
MRQRSGSRGITYTQVDSDEDLSKLNDVPLLQQTIYAQRMAASSSSTSICMVFSVFGALFLSSIGLMLRHDSPYLILKTEGIAKPDLAMGVFGAAVSVTERTVPLR